MSVHDLIAEQVRYYEERASEYDATALDDGRFADQVAMLEEALDTFGPTGNVLEIACGTGFWTRRLRERADALTAVDSSPRMLTINRAKLDDPAISYVLADVFDWDPAQEFDVIFFAFWLSHLPMECFEGFWGQLRAWLAAGGAVFFIDESHVASSKENWVDDPSAPEHPLAERRLRDGKVFRIPKLYWDPAALLAELTRCGWDAEVHSRDGFIWGRAQPEYLLE